MSESMDLREQEGTREEEKEKEKENGVETPPRVMMRQKSSTPKPRKDNRLSYIDNEIKVSVFFLLISFSRFCLG